jgi:hypothetical protein
MPSRTAVVAALAFAGWACGGCASEPAIDGTGTGGAAPSVSSSPASSSSGEVGQQPSPCGSLVDPPPFELGTGEICYEPLRDGQVVPHITGPQGGYHVWGGFLCPECPREVIATIGARFADTGEYVSEPSTRVVEIKGGQVAGLIAFLTGDSSDPTSHLAEGTLLDLALSIDSLEGAPLHSGVKRVELGEIVVWLNHCDPDPVTCGTPEGKKCCS